MAHTLGRDAPRAAFIGSGTPNPQAEFLAFTLGRAAAGAGFVTVCGGLNGVMAAACKGAKECGGLTIGILPGVAREAANTFVDIPIVTGLGPMRNALVVNNADIVFAFAGGAGTLSEIGFALKSKKPVIGVAAWSHLESIQIASTIEDALTLGIESVKELLSSIKPSNEEHNCCYGS